MRYFLLGLLVLIVTGCVPKVVNVEIDAELIPADQALAFFRSEEFNSGEMNQIQPCVLVETGVYDAHGFHSYKDLDFAVRKVVVDGPKSHFIYLRRKGDLSGCHVYYGLTDQGHLEKIATALVSLGIESENVERSH